MKNPAWKITDQLVKQIQTLKSLLSLQTIITKLLSNQQLAYIKERYIGENARLILDNFENCETENSDDIILYLTFEI